MMETASLFSSDYLLIVGLCRRMAAVLISLKNKFQRLHFYLSICLS